MDTVRCVDSLFINRELSWLEFNSRVLALAEETDIPLLERLKFIAIFSSNLDEFFQVRVGALHDRQEAGETWRSFDGLNATETLAKIRTRTEELCNRRDVVLSTLFEQLSTAGITLSSLDEMSEQDNAFLEDWFDLTVLPVLTPLSVDPGHPFPYISNLAINIGVMVTDPDTGDSRFARVKVPTGPRFINLGDGRYVVLEELIASRIGKLFPGMQISSPQVFRVTRNTDLTFDADEAEDLLEAVEMELRRRRFGNAVRLEVVKGFDPTVMGFLLEELELDPIDVYQHDRLVGGSELWELHRADRPDLRDTPWTSVTAGRLAAASAKSESFFSVIRHRDLLVHHPYETFSTSTEEFIRQASMDPKVRAIKATLYRTSADSPIARSLITAAERGVQVAALVELTARFDEQTNVRWAKELERAGAHVVYGMVGLKTHAKCLLVVREEDDGLRRYAHIGTGNYNSSTALVYEDLGLFTCDDDLTEDVAHLFNFLTGFSKSPGFTHLVTAPENLRPTIVSLIRREAALGTEGRISMKVNSLVDDEMIRELIAAARTGCSVDLLIRGICSMSKSTLPGANVRIRSVLGRYLEHSRIYRFGGPDSERVEHLIGSADMMMRNLDLRVEALVPVSHPKHKAWLDHVLDTLWAADVVAWELDGTNEWKRTGPTRFTFESDAQGRLMKWATELQTSHGEASRFDVADGHDPAGARPSLFHRLWKSRHL